MRLFKKKQAKSAQERTARGDVPQQRVISYYTASRRQLDNFERTSPQAEIGLADRRLERMRESWFTLLVTVVGIIIIGYVSSLSTQPHVSVQGTQYRSLSDYEQRVRQAFGSDARNRLKPFLQTTQLERAISATLPEARIVQVSSSLLGHRPEVKIITDEPVAIFSQPGSIDYILSNRGRLLLAASAAKKTDNLPIIQNQTGVQGKAGEQFMRPDETTAFMRLLAQFAVDGSKPIFTLSTTPHEIIAKESGRGNYYERFLLSETITSQYGSLRATQKKLQELGQTPAEYIDVRLVDKAYYK
jgi:hypothetical protein